MTDFPWEHPWRQELQRALGRVPASRRPALRRSPLPDYLFSTDLPLCAAPEAVSALEAALAAEGWEGLRQGNWLHLRRPGPPPEGWFPLDGGEEARCLRVLLDRHPGSAPGVRELLALMKAREEGPAPFERVCRGLHRELARRLRTGEPLPNLYL